MALIKCTECGKQISDQAASCPGCGAPVGVRKDPEPIRTIQETGKPLKKQILLSVLLCIVSMIVMIYGSVDNNGPVATFGGVAMFLSGVWFIATRIRIWWHHK